MTTTVKKQPEVALADDEPTEPGTDEAPATRAFQGEPPGSDVIRTPAGLRSGVVPANSDEVPGKIRPRARAPKTSRRDADFRKAQPQARPEVPTRPSESMVETCLRYLKAEGVRYVFGIPGGLLHPFFDAVELDKDLEMVVAKHECGAAFMADGFARVGQRLAVVAATSGPGATNLMTGVAVAYSDGVPMLVITGQAPSHSMGKGAAQETTPEDIDIVSMFRPVTKYSAMVLSPDRLSHHVRRALRLALTGRPGPVHLNVPVDFWGKRAPEEWFEPESYRPPTELFDRASVQQAADALLSAKHPVFLVGAGAGQPETAGHLEQLAEYLGARVATTPRGKGTFPEDHPLSLGVFGFAGHAYAKDMVLSESVDLVFSIGASLNEVTTYNWNPDLKKGRTLIQLDIDVDRIARNYPVDIPLVGDAATILNELIHHTRRAEGRGQTRDSQWPPPPDAAAPLEIRYENGERRTSDEEPVQPERWRADLETVLPDNAIIFSDIGGHMLFNVHHLRIKKGQRFVLNLGFGSMGHGTVAPIGAALACPDRPVFAIIGDACFTMNGMELLTAVEYNIPVIWIVENNQMHGITWHGSRMVNLGRPMESIVYERPLDVAEIARGMSLHVETVYRPQELIPAVQSALAAERPALIDIITDPFACPPMSGRVKTIAGFRRK